MLKTLHHVTESVELQVRSRESSTSTLPMCHHSRPTRALHSMLLLRPLA